MRRFFLWVGMIVFMLGAACVFLLAMPDHPYYGTNVEIARFEEMDEPEGSFPPDATEAFDRFAYGFLGLVLCIGGAMIIESSRFGSNP